MSDQLTVRLSPEIAGALRAAARQMQRKPSEVVRMALREFLALPGPEGRRPSERIRGLIGSLDSGIPDLTRTRRAAVIESVKSGR
jgi:hypothetical protein